MLIYAAVLGFAGLGFYELWSFRMAAALRLSGESLQAMAVAVDATARSATNHVAILRVEAERALQQPPPETPHPLRQALVAFPDADRFALTQLPAGVPPELGTYLVGSGDPAMLSVEVVREIEAALHLTPLFHRVKQNLPQAAWVYYTSANRFVSVYPLEAQWEHLTWNDAMLDHPVFADTAPERNPQRMQQWSETYVDEAGKGLMSSVTAPVADETGRFRGMVALDITLTTLNDYLTGPGLEIGRVLLANEHGQLLADPALVKRDDTEVRRLDDTLPPALVRRLADLVAGAPRDYREHEGWLLRGVRLKHAPWTAYHLIERRQLAWTTLSHMRVEMATLLLLALSIFLLEWRRRAAHRLRLYKAAVDASTSAIIITDRNAVIEYTNPSFSRITGFSSDEALGQTPRLFNSGRTAPEVFAQLWNVILSGESWHGELLNRRKNGELYWSDLRIATIPAPDGEPAQFVGLMNDISARKEAEQALIDSESYNKTLFEHSHVPQAILDPDSRQFIDCNDAAVALYGYTNHADIIGKSPLDLSAPTQADGDPSTDAARKRLTECLAAGSSVFEWRNRRPNGEIWDAEIRCMNFHHRDRTLIQFSLQDITERKRIDAQMTKAMVVFNASSQGIMTTDANRVITSVNPAFTAITGYTAEEIIGRKPSMLSSGRHDAAFYDNMWDSLASSGQWESEIWNRRKNGEIYPQWQTISAVTDERGKVIAYISLFNDITQRKQQEEAIWRQANFDALTGLANRSLLQDRLEQALTHARRARSRVGVLFLDLDGFKWINDTLGHDTGDELLVEVARRLTFCVREQDTVARLGGDEFTIVVHDLVAPDDLNAIAEKIVSVLRDPFALGGIQHRMSGSVGITVYPDDGEDVQTLFRNADIAMYKSKQAGKNRFQFYARDMQTDALARMKLEGDLRVALEQQAFSLHYQPIVDSDSGELVGAEALIRWQHPERGSVSPMEFIPVAEDSGLIIGIGEWALREAARQSRHWRDCGHGALRLAVNMSGVQFREVGLPDLVSSVLAEFGIDRGCLMVEITESVLMGGSEVIEARMRDIKALGIGYALDDFGTGFSSLSYLKRFPVDIVKIDRSFVNGCPDDRNDAHLVEAIINMAHSLDLHVTAEGVETEEQVSFLRDLGCDFLQGYLISKPLPAAEFEVLIARHFLLPSVDGATPEETRLLTALRDDQLDVDEWLRRLLGERSPELAAFMTREGWTRHGLDLKQAVKAHLNWRKYLNDYVSGLPSGSALDLDNAGSVSHCTLGQWIERHSGLPDRKLEELDRMHREFHKLAGQIVADYKQGYQASARRTLASLKFRTASRNVVIALIDCFDTTVESLD
nr:EAL domain-containing protein [Aromatoleum diolicum]